MLKYSRKNEIHKYILSDWLFFKIRLGFSIIKHKPKGIIESLKQIFKESGKKPKKLQVDYEREFTSKFSQFCENKINKFSSQNKDIKACIPGRSNRTIEEKIASFNRNW